MRSCRRPSPPSNSFNYHHVASSCWLATRVAPHHNISRACWEPADREWPRSRSYPQQMEVVQCWPPSGRAVHSPRRLASWVKLCPSRCPPLRPIGEINIHLWDLPWRSLEVTRPTGHGTCHHLKGCRLKGRSPIGAIAAHSAAKEAAQVHECRTSRRQPHWRKRVPLRNGHQLSIAKNIPLPTAALANRTFFKVCHAQTLLKFSHMRDASCV